MNQITYQYFKEVVTSKDGTVISYKVMGKGPGILLVHGGFRASRHYLELAQHLSGSFTVYILDRRGRNESGPKGEEYSIQKECDDAIAILQKHNVSLIFGHSYGGLIALNVALQYPLIKLAVYEPALISYIPSYWIPKFEEELEKNDFISAIITFLKGMQMGGFMSKLPRPILKILFRAMAKGPEWEENCQLFLTLPEEFHAGLNWDTSLERYRQISASTLIMTGTKTSKYLLTSAHELEMVLPNKQRVSFKGLDHNAPDEGAPEKIAPKLIEFFG